MKRHVEPLARLGAVTSEPVVIIRIGHSVTDVEAKLVGFGRTTPWAWVRHPRCRCCDRSEIYNGFASGPLAFVCPKSCPCHD